MASTIPNLFTYLLNPSLYVTKLPAKLGENLSEEFLLCLISWACWLRPYKVWGKEKEGEIPVRSPGMAHAALLLLQIFEDFVQN